MKEYKSEQILAAFEFRRREYGTARQDNIYGNHGALIGALNKACRGDENRKRVMKILTGKSSSKDLTLAEWYALAHMVKPYKSEITDRWEYREELDSWVQILMDADAVENGQMELAEMEMQNG